MKIRKQENADLESLRSLYLETRRRTFHWADPSLFVLQDFDKDTEGELIYVAELNAGVAGFISIWTADNFIHNLFVGENFQGQGIGKVLLNEGLEHVQRPVRLKCPEKNTQALDFYFHLGWVRAGEGVSDTGSYLLLRLD